MLTIGSLFSGIGGLELGLEWAGLGPVVWQVEKDPFCRLVLAKHYPEAKRFDDVCTVGANELARVDLICGGFPCQDVSSAGKRAGLAGERSGLWREFARVISELRPQWVVVENVTSGAEKWLDAVVCQLEERGYACLPLPISASDVGAPHRRSRVFVVANAHGDDGGCRAHDPRQIPRGSEPERRAVPGATSDAPVKHGVRKQGRSEPGWAFSAEPDRDGPCRIASDPLLPRRERSGPGSHASRIGPSAGAWGSPEPGVVPVVHGVSGGLAGRRRRARIRALGNSVVPQCAEVVGWVIRELAGLTEAQQ